MDDVRRMALERANRPKQAPIGASFESERQRSKNALVKQLDSMDGRNVRKIAAVADAPQEEKILRVAAYCRVSTDDIDQAISIHLQIQEYKKKILANPNWKYVGTYVDDGFSGTNTEHRQGFQKLMKDAMDGKIDMIITKAMSRFARNLMDCIGWVEALQNHDPPVRVFFEQENLDTMSQTSGIILFVLAMVAQEESHMKSEAILLSLEWRFSRGRFLTPRLFGYDKVEVPDGFGGKKKILAINEAEARVVRWMYATLLNGGTPEEKYYDAEDFDEYVAGASKMAEKTYNMEENAEKNNRDAFSAAILDSKLKSEAKAEGGYTDENLLYDTYKVEKEAFSSREEPVDKSVGTRLPSEVLKMLGIRKADIGVELEDQLRVLEREGKNASQAYEKAVELNDASGAAREMTRIKSLREAYNTAKAKLSKYRNGSMSDNEMAETERDLHKEKHTVKGSKELWESIAAKEAAIKAEAEKRRLQNSPNNDKVDSTNSKVERAKELLANGASPSQIFNETGLVVTADGKITDGFTRAKVGSYNNGQNGAADQVTGKNQVSGTSESGVSSDDGRRVRGEFSEQSREKASWEALGESERNAAREVIQRRIDSVETEEADELRLSYDTDEELMRDIYKSYEDGSAALEEWTPYFGDMNELASELDKALSGANTNTNTQDTNSNYNADNINHSTGSNTAERVYVDKNGNEYDPKTGYTTRTAEEVQAERDAHISDDLYYTLRAEDRLTPDNAKEWAQWQQRREERQNAQKAPVTDETAWKDAEAEFGGANHDAIYKATQKAEEFETFLESDAFASRLTDEQYSKVSDSVTEFKNKLAGLGDGHTSFAEFAEYYKAMKDSSILGDLYSERVNEQVQLARELAEEAYSNPIPYNVEKYRHAAVKAAQMASHYIEKASKVRAELDELNNAVRENGSKRKPTELGREVERGEKGNSLREKAAAKFIRWQIMPRQMFQMIDGFKFWENGAGYRMADTIESAAAKNQMILVEANDFFADVVKMKGYYDFATGKTKTSVRLGGETLTMSEAVSLYKAIKTMGGPDAYRVQNIEGFALKNGDKKPHMIKADPANISGLYSALQTAIAKNEVASAYVKAFDSMSERLGKEAQDIAKAIDGVDNELFKPGDYFPLTYARVEDGNFKWDKADSKDFGVPDFKNLKERTRTAGGYVNIAPVVEVTDGYIRRAADYIAFGELADTFGMMDYMHTFGMSTLTDTVNREMGSEYGSWMRNYVNDVQDLNQTRAKSRDNWWQKLMLA